MKKKNKKIILLIVLILLVSILTFIVQNSFARYATYVNGHGVMQVAQWSFKANNQTETIANINLASTCTAETLADGKLAPGTYGSFDIVVDGTGSDVAIEYKVKFSNDSQMPRNLKFYCNGYSVDRLSELNEKLVGTINANDTQKVKTITVDWYWHYTTGEGEEQIQLNNEKDTYDAQHMTNCQFDVTISGVQIVPAERS